MDLLFVYGSLLDSGNEYAGYVRSHSHFLSYGKLKGHLYDLGSYPGAVADATGKEYIFGSVLKADNIHDLLQVIDDYEGFGENQDQPNEFVRRVGEIETDSGVMNCWVYLYNLPVWDYLRIMSGKYKL